MKSYSLDYILPQKVDILLSLTISKFITQEIK